jgi:signal peptide peptidase SppA
MSGYNRILRAVRSQPWAIMPDKLEAILGFLEIKSAGGAISEDLLSQIHAQAEVTAARAKSVSAASSGSVTVLPVYGMIMHRGNMMGDISGPRGTSTEQLSAQLRQAINDPNVKAIVMDFDTPGGTVDGVPELAAEILDARGKKQITAVSNCLCASAGYWLASACSEIVASESSLTGSVGVYAAHQDESAALEKEGVKVTLIQYGENKTNGNPYQALSEDARSNMQKMVNAYGTMFDKSVAKGRKTSAAKVHENFGQGLVFTAADAVSIGMVDSIGTLDDVLAKYGVSRHASASLVQERSKLSALRLQMEIAGA